MESLAKLLRRLHCWAWLVLLALALRLLAAPLPAAALSLGEIRYSQLAETTIDCRGSDWPNARADSDTDADSGSAMGSFLSEVEAQAVGGSHHGFSAVAGLASSHRSALVGSAQRTDGEIRWWAISQCRMSWGLHVGSEMDIGLEESTSILIQGYVSPDARGSVLLSAPSAGFEFSPQGGDFEETLLLPAGTHLVAFSYDVFVEAPAGAGPPGSGEWVYRVDFSIVPEPSPALLLASGLIGLAINGRRRRA